MDDSMLEVFGLYVGDNVEHFAIEQYEAIVLQGQENNRTVDAISVIDGKGSACVSEVRGRLAVRL